MFISLDEFHFQHLPTLNITSGPQNLISRESKILFVQFNFLMFCVDQDCDSKWTKIKTSLVAPHNISHGQKSLRRNLDENSV